MRRSFSQTFYKYLPNMVVDYNENSFRGIVKVVKWDYRLDPESEKYKEEIVRNIALRIKNYIYNKEFPKDSELDNPINYLFVRLKSESITSIKTSIFPEVFQCPDCKRLLQLKNGKKKEIPKCPGKSCNSKLSQIDIVTYHHCGELKSLNIPNECRVCKKKSSFKFVKFGSSSPYMWELQCLNCSNKMKLSRNQVCYYCKNKECNVCDNYQMKIAPFRKREIFNPLRINLPATKLVKNDQGMDGSRELLKKYLFQGIEIKLSEDDSKEIEKLRINIENLEPEEIEAVIKKRKEKLLKKKYEQYLPEKIISDLLKQDITILALNQLNHIFNVLTRSNISLPEKAKKQYHKIGIDLSNSFFTENFKLLMTTYGYIRDGYEDPLQRCFLKKFPPFSEERDKIPILLNSIETEAIVLKFEEENIVNFLQTNGFISKDRCSNKVDERLLLLEEGLKSDVLFYAPIASQNTIQKIIYTILHTISHSLIKSASQFSGFDIQGLSEIILPEISMVIIYHNQSSNFNLGGLLSLFSDRYKQWIDNATETLDTCKYDPLCKSFDSGDEELGKAACHGCIHIPETSCNHLNYDLDRNIMIRSKHYTQSFLQGIDDEINS